MPAAQPVSDPNATRYMLVKTHSPEGLAAIVDIIVSKFCMQLKQADMHSHEPQKDAVAQKDFVAAMIPTTSSGGAMAYRFDSIRDAAAAVAAARDYLPGPAVQIAFINSTTYKQFDPSLMDLNEGTITFLIQASLPAAELRVAAVDEAGRFGVVHSNEVLREDRNFLSLKIIFDSVKAAEFAVKELTGAKAGYMRQVGSMSQALIRTIQTNNCVQGATIQAVRFQGASFLGMNKIRNDSTQLTGDGVKLNPGYAMNGANFFDTSSLNGSSSAIAPLRTQGPIFDQPSLHFSGAYGVNYPPRAGPSGLMPAYGAFNHTSGMMGKGPRGNRNSNPVDLNRIMEGSDIRTTIMLRNIPNKMTAAELKQIIDKTSFGRYDFSYLRIDFHNQCNVGYAFINFTKPEYIIPFFQEHNGRPWGLYNSDKIAELSYATRQGLMSLIDLFQNSCVMEEIPEHRPKLWYTEVDGAWCGQEKPFPAPTNLQKVRCPLVLFLMIRMLTSSQLQRSRDMAATVGLYPPRGNRGFHHDERHRMSQYDRGTPQAIRDAQLNMAAYHGMGYPAMAPGFPAMGGPFTYPYGYPPVSPFFPPYHM